MANAKTGFEQVSTPWELLRAAHHGGDAARDAQAVLIERYRRAVYRYFVGALRDQDSAEELFQEFAFRFVRGDFRNANPEAGRFRDYLRSSLSHMINDYRRKRDKSPGPLPHDLAGRAPKLSDDDALFLVAWRTELINQAWSALESENPTQHAVLHFYTSNSDCIAADAAAHASRQLGKSISSAHVRVILHRARQRFAELVLKKVAETLEAATRKHLVAELRALNLLKLCSRALQAMPGDE